MYASSIDSLSRVTFVVWSRTFQIAQLTPSVHRPERIELGCTSFGESKIGRELNSQQRSLYQDTQGEVVSRDLVIAAKDWARWILVPLVSSRNCRVCHCESLSSSPKQETKRTDGPAEIHRAKDTNPCKR